METPREKINREMRSGLYALFILKAIEELGESYGYEIIKHLERKSGGRVKLKDATVYPILRYFQRKRILEAYWTEPGKGVPRKYYRLTEKGKGLLKDLLEDYKMMRDMANRILEVRK